MQDTRSAYIHYVNVLYLLPLFLIAKKKIELFLKIEYFLRLRKVKKRACKPAFSRIS